MLSSIDDDLVSVLSPKSPSSTGRFVRFVMGARWASAAARQVRNEFLQRPIGDDDAGGVFCQCCAPCPRHGDQISGWRGSSRSRPWSRGGDVEARLGSSCQTIRLGVEAGTRRDVWMASSRSQRAAKLMMFATQSAAYFWRTYSMTPRRGGIFFEIGHRKSSSDTCSVETLEDQRSGTDQVSDACIKRQIQQRKPGKTNKIPLIR